MARPGPRVARCALALALAALGPVARADDVTPPRLVGEVAPAWPDVRAEVHDVIVPVVLEVGADGSVLSVQIEASVGAEYDAEAARAAKQWRFAPALRGGSPVPARIRSVVRFRPPTPPAPPPEDQAAAQHRIATASHAEHGHEPEDEGAEPTPAPTVEVQVVGRAGPVSRGSSDYRVHVGELARVPRATATELLRLAPGVFLQNEGGPGHSDRIFLRGFDAREGQDVELTVDGVPANDPGSPHGNGVADLQFIIPEAVHSLRVLEGPYDPRQGNFSVAGSAEYELGLDRRGLTAKATVGSFGTERLLLLWGPPGERLHTFAAAEHATSDGFGENRALRRATALGQYEGRLGRETTLRLASAVSSLDAGSAGLVRADDVDAGKIGRLGTYDPRQGTQGTRFHASADVETRSGSMLLYQQIFAIRRTLRLRQNYTGFLLDDQEPTDSPHGQRGDLLDAAMQSSGAGARGFARAEDELFGHKQSVELGYFARLDDVTSRRQRLVARSEAPYRTVGDLESTLSNVGLYADLGLRPVEHVTLRGGLRSELLTYDVLDRCAVRGVSRPRADPSLVDASCFDQQRFGDHREPDQRSTAAGAALLPRATLLLGPFRRFTFSFAYGKGVRSIDPAYVTQDVPTPFARIESAEGGVTWARGLEGTSLEARSVFFATHVDRDHVFSETEGRTILGGGTTRAGWAGSLRATSGRWDENLSLALVRSTFDDTGLLVPYAPDLVLRSDGVYSLPLPLSPGGHRMTASFAAGAGYVGRRALPFGQRSAPIFLIDGSASLDWSALSLQLAATNLLDSRYASAESFYASSFTEGAPPSLVPARHLSAGSPRTVLVSLAATFGGGS
ncbi:MAG: TonB family protein [Deltaproteobacteria bacterium]|nr:TonB family protein [Deltaproteobacteria bacterium]